jgi:hypothetical protein
MRSVCRVATSVCSIELLAKRPRTWIVKDFLNPFEVAHFISLGRGTPCTDSCGGDWVRDVL